MRIDAMEFYGLTKGFRQAGFFETPHHKNLIQQLKIEIAAGGLIAISGIVGCGKTVTLRRLQDQLMHEGRVVVSKVLSVDKNRVGLGTLIAALYYDLSPKKDMRIPSLSERRERELQELIKQRRRPVALFVDEAHDLHPHTLRELKRLLEVVQDGGGKLAVVLVGHPKLKNDLRRPTMEEIGYRTRLFTLEGVEGSRREYIEWLLSECTEEGVGAHSILEAEAIDLLAERLTTPLQIEEHLRIALEAGHEADEKPISAALVQSIISGALSDWEVTLTRNGYDTKSLANLLNAKSSEIRQLFRGELDPARTREMRDQLLVVGLPVK